MSIRNWRVVKDPVDTALAISTVLLMGGGVAVLVYALLRTVFG